MGQPIILTIKTYKWLIYVFYNISEKLFLLNSLFTCFEVINWFYHLKNFTVESMYLTISSMAL